jgi:hypothetical protein
MNQNDQHQKGAPQDTAEMPSSGNSPAMTGAKRGSDEAGTGTGDVERSSTTGAAATSPRGVNMAGDPGRTPGSAEGVEDFEETGNQ